MEGTKDYWSMTEGVFNCLIDHKRTLAFQRAIINTVKEGDIVVDMGTGSGILAMFAVEAGAKKVYAVEVDEKNYWNLDRNFKDCGYENKIELIKEDIRVVKIPEKIDVVIGEMIATGLIEELQIPAMNNVLKYAKDNVKVLLKYYENYLDLVYNNDKFYGYQLKIIRYEYSDIKETVSDSFSEKKMYANIDFTKENYNNKIDRELILTINKNGKINGLRISSRTIFNDGSIFDDSFAFSYPIILPINEQKVQKGDVFKVRISYELCLGFNSLNYVVSKI